MPLLPLCHHSTAAKGRHGRRRQRSAAGLTCAQQQKACHFRLESWQNCPTYRHFQLSTNYLSLISKWALRTFEPIKIKNYYNQSKNHLMGFTPRVESVSRILPSPPIYVRKIWKDMRWKARFQGYIFHTISTLFELIHFLPRKVVPRS